MKVAVLNFSGNVGKTTVSRHLLLPRMPQAEAIAIESVNMDAAQAGALRGEQFGELAEYLQATDAAVVDVGASNIEEFLERMRRFQGSHEEFDGFVVPTVPAAKPQQDTIATLHELLRLGIPATKIRVLLNLVDHRDDPQQAFAVLKSYTDEHAPALFNPRCLLQRNEVYERAKSTPDRSLADLAADPTDFKTLIAREPDKARKLALARQLGTRRLAQGVLPELDACFAALDLQ